MRCDTLNAARSYGLDSPHHPADDAAQVCRARRTPRVDGRGPCDTENGGAACSRLPFRLLSQGGGVQGGGVRDLTLNGVLSPGRERQMCIVTSAELNIWAARVVLRIAGSARRSLDALHPDADGNWMPGQMLHD